jgi:hypothetical protein
MWLNQRPMINFADVKSLVFLFAFLVPCTLSFGQAKNDLLIGLQTDLIKTGNAAYFQRFQSGIEGNYFFHQHFTMTGGIEYWTQTRQLSLVTGLRWYPADDAFVRVRGLLGANDFSFGGGWSKPLRENLRFEAISDFYFAGQITIRAGFTYTILNTSD